MTTTFPSIFRHVQDPHPEYNLFGTIVHSGHSPDSGHYYAYIKDALGRWYCCNDSYVSLSTLQEVLSEKVYILFFSRTKQRPVPASTVLASNGVKSQDCNGSDAFKSPMAANPTKAVHAKQFVNHSSEKDNVTKSKVDKVPSIPQMKLSSIGNSGTKRFPATVNLKIVHKGQSNEQNGDVKASTCSDKSEKSMIHRNGVSKSRTVDAVENENSQAFPLANGNGNGNGVSKSRIVDAVDNENSHTFPLANGNGKIQSIHINSVEADLREDIDTRNKVTTGRGPNYHELQNGGVNCSSDISGYKRKLPNEDSCILFAKDDHSTAKLEELKEVLRRDSSLVLRSCGWLDEVYSYMRDRKKLHAREASDTASNSNESKRLLITDAKQTFISQIPESLKENLIERLKSFSQERQCSGP